MEFLRKLFIYICVTNRLTGMPDILRKDHAGDKRVWFFLLLWAFLNVVQAYFTELHADEAYYWVYSKFPAWGYFDHPPMVAVFIRIGDSLMHNELGLRLMTVVTSLASFYILWLILKKYAISAKWYILVVSSILIFHVYGFTSAPDAALFFFAALFYFYYQRYCEEDKVKFSLAIGLVLVGLLYSKYHGVLMIFFTLLSNPKLFTQRSFWLIATIVTLGYLPHIIWQVNHGYPSVNYHLFDRSSAHYDPIFTLGYLLGQLLVAGPLVGWFWFYRTVKVKSDNLFVRALLFNFYGTLVFFLLNTLKGNVQPQWTLIAYLPLLMLTLISLKKMERIPKWLAPLTIINILLILFARLGLMVSIPVLNKISVLKKYHGNKEWALDLKEKAGDAYIMFYDGFQEPSKYDYYTNSLKGFAYDSKTYRKTQFDIWPIEDSLQHKRVYLALEKQVSGLTTDTVLTPKKMFYGGWIDQVRTYQKVNIELPSYKYDVHPNAAIKIELTIINPYAFPIDFADTGYQHQAFLKACFLEDGQEVLTQIANTDFKKIRINPGEQVIYPMTVFAPQKEGKYDLVFSIQTDPFPGSRNNRFVKLNVKK
ncbi:MAG: ArnT family glycosyltransferase [Sphingobacteriaceae bacterium]